MRFVESESKDFGVSGRGGNASILFRDSWLSAVVGDKEFVVSSDTSFRGAMTFILASSVVPRETGLEEFIIFKLCELLVSVFDGWFTSGLDSTGLGSGDIWLLLES